MIRKYDALIQYFTRRDPTTLTDEQWAILVKDLEWARDQERLQSLKQIGSLLG